MKQSTKELVRLRLGRLEKSLMRAVVSFDPEDIHLYRVEIKKLRAFLHLCGKGWWGDKPKLWRALHAFYKMSGEIRNLQLQQQRVRETWKDKKESMPRGYLSVLSLEMTAALLSAGRFARDKIDFSRNKTTLMARIPSHLSKKDIRHFVLGTLSTLKLLTSPIDHLSDADLHSIRKLLKDLQYNLPYVKNEMAVLSPRWSTGKESGMESLTATLGEFQDICSSLALMQPCYLQRVPDEAERVALRGWKAEIEVEKRQCREKILNLLTQWGIDRTAGHLYVARNGSIRYER